MKNDDSMTQTNESTTSLSIIRQPNNFLAEIDIFGQSEKAIEFFKLLIASGDIPASTPQQAMVYYAKAKELGLPFLTSMSHMNIINGKAGVDYHVMRALVLRAGSVYWEKTKDYEPLYKYTDGTKVQIEGSDKPVAIATYLPLIPDKEVYAVVGNADQSKEARSEGKIPIFRLSGVPVDYITEYTFHRIIKTPVGNKEIIEYGRYSISEAQNAGLFSNKAWQNHQRVMCDNRAWKYGATMIADDILFGLLSLDELYEISGKNYDMNKDGNIIVIND